MDISRRFLTIASVTMPMGIGATQAAGQSDRTQSERVWPFNGGHSATRFPPLTQIDPASVETLREAGRFAIPETLSFQSDEVVAGDTLFTTRRNSYRMKHPVVDTASGPSWAAIVALPVCPSQSVAVKRNLSNAVGSI